MTRAPRSDAQPSSPSDTDRRPARNATGRAVFIDFDGTYADHGIVPAEHAAAVQEARANGHLVFLCTGRPLSMIPDGVLDGVFDGLVAAAGGYVCLDGHVLSDVRFPQPLGDRLVSMLDEHDVVYILEAPTLTYVRSGTEQRLEQLLSTAVKSEQGPRDILQRIEVVDSFLGVSFSKATCFAASVALVEIQREIADQVALLPSSLPDLGPGAGEFYLPHITKAVGIDVVQNHLGLDTADVIAIGDGHNDLEMIEHAGIGVAVDVAPEDVQAAASMIIPGPADLGLLTAFTRLGLTAPRP